MDSAMFKIRKHHQNDYYGVSSWIFPDEEY
jgi:hypothetical protein